MKLSSTKRQKDNLRQAKEREPLPPPKGYLRSDFVSPYDDIPLKGVLFYLQRYEAMTTNQLSRMMLFGIRRIDDIIRLLQKRYTKDVVQHTGNVPNIGKQRAFKQYSIGSEFKDIPIDNLYKIVVDSMSKNSTNLTINESEKHVELILNNLVKGWFRYIGNDRSYKIGKYTPDFIDEQRGLIVEFNGPHHDPWNTVETTYELHVLNRKEKYSHFGWKLFPISHRDIKGKGSEDLMKSLLIDFLEDNKNRSHEEVYDRLLNGTREEKKLIKRDIVYAI